MQTKTPNQKHKINNQTLGKCGVLDYDDDVIWLASKYEEKRDSIKRANIPTSMRRGRLWNVANGAVWELQAT